MANEVITLKLHFNFVTGDCKRNVTYFYAEFCPGMRILLETLNFKWINLRSISVKE